MARPGSERDRLLVYTTLLLAASPPDDGIIIISFSYDDSIGCFFAQIFPFDVFGIDHTPARKLQVLLLQTQDCCS